MDVVAKLTLVASVLMLGYSLYQVFTSYDALCEKIEEFKRLAKESDSDESSIRLSNFLLTGVLSVIFVVLVYFADLAYWFVGLVLVKLLVTLLLSQLEVTHIFRPKLDRRFFMLSKFDSFVNALVAIAVAVVVIS